jgi:dimethylargininase
MRFSHAIVRTPGSNFADGLTTSAWTESPSFERLMVQHRAYVAALRDAGLSVETLPTLDAHPDAYFVEDVAVVVPELAIVTRPGAPERRGEVDHIVEALAARRTVVRIESPATLDGGDVLVTGRRVFVGLSGRTNEAGVASLRRLLGPHGYVVEPIPVAAGLHLKSSVSLVGPNTLVVAPAFADRPELAEFEQIVVSEAEAYSANAVWLNERVLVAAGFRMLADRVRNLGLAVIELDMSEVAKMDGGLSCLSLRC